MARFLPTFRIVVAGGGVGGLEACLAVQALARRRVALTLIAPDPSFIHRPATVADPVAVRTARRAPLDRVAEAAGAALHQDRLAAVDTNARRVITAAGAELPYDALLVAVGAVPQPVLLGAVPVGDRHDAVALRGALTGLRQGAFASAAFVAPPAPAWRLELYELALQLAVTLRGDGIWPAAHARHRRGIAARDHRSARFRHAAPDAPRARHPGRRVGVRARRRPRRARALTGRPACRGLRRPRGAAARRPGDPGAAARRHGVPADRHRRARPRHRRRLRGRRLRGLPGQARVARRPAGRRGGDRDRRRGRLRRRRRAVQARRSLHAAGAPALVRRRADRGRRRRRGPSVARAALAGRARAGTRGCCPRTSRRTPARRS